MLSNITSNPPKQTYPRQAPYQEGDLVYLYGDPEYTGRLIRPIERTYPPKWTVQLDRGGYEAVNSTQISLIKSEISNQVEQNYPIPFSDEPEVSTSQLESQLQKEIIALRKENEILSKDLEQAKQIIRRAKDVSPIMRLSLRRVMR
jgi:hypothetical protein